MSTAPTATARLALPYLFAGQTQKELFVNEAFARVDAAVHPTILGEASTPPAEAGEGDSYLVASGATGAWSGHEGAVATFAAGAWLFRLPLPGLAVWETGRNALAVWDGTAWMRASKPAAPTGGGTVDTEARAAFATLCDGLRMLGIFSA